MRFATLCALALASCSALEDERVTTADCEDFSCLVANQTYRYRPNREARQPVAGFLPGAVVLPESAYEPIESGTTHAVTFSADLDSVELVSVEDRQRSSGTLMERTPQRIVYDLDAFAGGEFIVEIEQDELEAELTLFGSGVPITSSTRGLLEPVPKK